MRRAQPSLRRLALIGSSTGSGAQNTGESADRSSGAASVGSYLEILTGNPYPQRTRSYATGGCDGTIG
jgi:hypothetical protein